MKKVFSSLLSVVLSCSMMFTFVSSVSASEIEAASVNPKITGQVSTVASGRALIEFKINSDATYSAEYDDLFGIYSGDEASGFSTIDVQFTLSDDVDSLFSSIMGTSVTGSNPVTVNDKNVIYSFSVGSPSSYAQNGDTLFRLVGVLKDSNMTLETLKTYNLVKEFTRLNVYTKIWPVTEGKLAAAPTYETMYRSDGNGDYDTITAEYIYTAPAPEPAVNSVTINEGDTATVNGGETKQLTATVDAVNGADDTVTWSIDPATPATISPDGLFTAPEATEVDQVFTVKATSTFDGSKSDSIEITVPKKEVPQPQQPTTDITGAAVEKGVYFDVKMNGNGEAITDANVVVAGPTADGEGKEVTFKVIGYGDIEGELSFIIGILTDIAGDYRGTSNVTTSVDAATDSASVTFSAQ